MIGWKIPCIREMCRVLGFRFRSFFGCGLGLVASNGLPIRKPWKMATDCEVLIEKLDPELNPCTHSEHQPCVGQFTKDSALYPPKLAKIILESFAEQADIDYRRDNAKTKNKAAMNAKVCRDKDEESAQNLIQIMTISRLVAVEFSNCCLMHFPK